MIKYKLSKSLVLSLKTQENFEKQTNGSKKELKSKRIQMLLTTKKKTAKINKFSYLHLKNDATSVIRTRNLPFTRGTL